MSQIWNLLHSLSVVQEMGERHHPGPGSGAFHVAARSIEEYVAAGRRHVEQGRTDLDSAQRDWIIEGNSPFVLWPDAPGRPRRAILVVHGLTDAPFLVRDVAEFFRAEGFLVLGMLLPGHGTRPGDLLHTRWQDWLAAHQHLLTLLRAQADEIHLLGFSAGATLNLYQALRNDDIRALYLFSPALRVRRLASLASPLAWLGKWSRRLAWFDVQPDTDCFKYESLANRAIREVFRMILAFGRLNRLKALQVPVFVAASARDITINAPAILDWFGAQGVTPRRMLYYSTGQPAVPARVKVVPAYHPQSHIRSYAHTALLSAPDNPHYGEAGSQRFCTHYYRLDPAKYRRCKAGDEDCLGEMFDESPDCQVVRRLTFNPLFEDMLTEIKSFLVELESAAEARSGQDDTR